MSATDSSTPPPHTVHVVHPAPSRFQGLGAVAMLLGTVIALGVTGVFMWSLYQNRPQPIMSTAASDTGDVASLRDRLASDEARLAALERGGPGNSSAQTASLAQAQGDLASLSARVGKLETAPDPQAAARLDETDRRLTAMRADMDLRVAALERNALGSDLPQRIASLISAQTALEARIAKLENIAPTVTMRRAAAELALANLVRASGEPAPFAAELQTFKTMMPDATEAGALGPISLRGAPTQAGLAQEFPSVAARALEAEARAQATTWLGRLWANIGNIVVIRRIGDVKGDDSESILARAGARLNGGDLESAVREVKSLKGAARASAHNWLNEAEARLAIQHATAALAHRLALLLAAP